MKLAKVLPLLITGTLILSLIGFYNGYPLVYSDTGTYIYSGFDQFIPNDRPIGYGLFLKLFSFNYSLWFVIFVQNFITAYVLYKTFRTLVLPDKKIYSFYYLTILFLVFFTAIGWYSNQIMPDLFAPIAILSVYILLRNRNLHRGEQIFLAILLVFSLISHFSHLLMISLIVVLILLLKTGRNHFLKAVPFRRIIIITSLVLSSWFILPGINYLVEKEFILSKGSHVFLMAHLADTGILQEILNDKCGEEEFKKNKICAYKDDLPTDLASFIWNDSVFIKTGGWVDSREEYKKIISVSLTDPKFLLMNLYKSITYGLIQLTKNETGQGLTPYIKGSAPYGQIHWRFPNELNNYLNSRQNHWGGAELSFKALNKIHLSILIISLFGLSFLFSFFLIGKLNTNTAGFLFFIILAVILNAFVTAGLNAPVSRFQARVVWLVPFALILLIFENYGVFWNYIKSGRKML